MSQQSNTTDKPINESDSTYSLYKVKRRDGSIVSFAPDKIAVAMTKAFLAIEGSGTASSRVKDIVQKLKTHVVDTLIHRLPGGGIVHIENIQDNTIHLENQCQVFYVFQVFQNLQFLRHCDL